MPTVLTQSEARAVIGQLLGVYRLVVQLLYGSGWRQTECLQLRVKDVDFGHHQLVVRDAKGGESRVTMLPDSAVESLEEHLQAVKRLHQQDLEQAYGSVYLPFALARKYPNADRQWIWQYVFPSERRSCDPRSGIIRRHHLDPSGLQKAVKTTMIYTHLLNRGGRGVQSPLDVGSSGERSPRSKACPGFSRCCPFLTPCATTSPLPAA